MLDALASEPGATKRDLARLLKVKGGERIALKRILKELDQEGTVTGNRKKGYTRPGELPEVTVLEITGQDTDGELLGRPQRWESNEEPPKIYILPGRDGDAGPALGRGERVLARLEKIVDGYEARVIKRLGASAHKVLGVAHLASTGMRIAPIDRKSRTEFSVDARDRGGAQNNELVLAEPIAGRASGLPRARIVERLGNLDEPKAVSLIAIHAHGIPTDFPKEALDEANGALPADPHGRTDLRKFALLTIDPEDARDHDDAVWAAADPDPENKGGHIAIVAIADVSHYVRPGSPLDREAYKRGNSVYFPDRVVPMLPERLSADLCSLMEGVDRPCLAVRMVFDSQGRKKRHEFLRAIMRSAASLTYRQAQEAFDGKPDPAIPQAARTALKAVWACYRSLVVARKQRDPLDLDLPERRIVIGSDGKVQSIAFRQRLESMRLIEEFMVLANVAAAEALEKARMPLVYRVHEHPSQEKIFSFADYLRTIDMSFAKGQVIKPGAFNRILATAKGGPHEQVMNDVVLRTQAQAVYSSDNVGHFGLNLQRYAHFTSPIRRYADLIVHRALIRALKLGAGGLSDKEMARLSEMAEHISMTERRAMAAERDSTDRYVAAFMQDRIGAVFEGRITGVTRFGLFLRLAETGADGLLPARALGFEYFRHDEKRHAMVGDRTGTSYKLGDIVRVKLVEAAPLTGGLRFELAEPQSGGARRPAPFVARRRGRRR
ncbi:MAG: ribonuclease R [Alphaproteobacteria bacterium]|nr:ribonuclease R [Alphaproteobacteria bacterium]MBV9694849.1 ribonuclease R [Alphaproteobacteria bacterium]